MLIKHPILIYNECSLFGEMYISVDLLEPKSLYYIFVHPVPNYDHMEVLQNHSKQVMRACYIYRVTLQVLSILFPTLFNQCPFFLPPCMSSLLFPDAAAIFDIFYLTFGQP